MRGRAPGIAQILKLQRSIQKPLINKLPQLKNTDAYDTLIIVDTLNITGTYTHNAGDHIIFKGGVTWGHANFPWVIPNGGVAGNPDYYGVDKT